MAAQTPIDYRALAEKHGGTSARIERTDYTPYAKRNGGITITPTLPHESKDAVFTPELKHLEHAVQPVYVQGDPYKGKAGDAIASVSEHEPHKVEINNVQRFNQGPNQTKAHELVHLMFSQLPGPLQKQVPADDPKHPYDISQAEHWRSSGKKLWNLPQEVAATIIQRYVADPGSRSKLQPWMNDLTTVPLSVVQPTAPDAKAINLKPRAPIPPVESFGDLTALLQEAKNRDPRKKTNSLPAQPKEALNQYANPEDQPPKVSFEFNKAWSKPGPYTTKLPPQEEIEFRKWAAANLKSVEGEVGPAPNFEPLPMADYDVRAHFHAAKANDPAASLVPNKWDGKLHGNDKFKTPYNGGFSNESMYALPKAPRWVGNKLVTSDGKLVTDETPRK